MSDLFNLDGKVIVVTGGFGLLGRPLVSCLVGQGARVVVFETRGEETVSEGGGDPASARPEVRLCDITDSEAVTRAVRETVKGQGRIDCLINSAYPKNENYGRRFEEIRLEDWNDNVDRHLGGTFNVTQKVALEMIRQKRGSLINIASIYGMVAPDFSIYEGTPMTMPAEYAAIKGGLINLTRYLATYLAPHGIRVNSISPGGIYSGQDPQFVKAYEKRVPMGRMATPEDLFGAVVFMASDASRYMTGQNIAIDGGWTAW